MSPNHPNRGTAKASPARNPKPEEIRQAREASGLTQAEAGALIYVSERGWQKWEQGERAMHPAFMELWQLKAKRESARKLVGDG